MSSNRLWKQLMVAITGRTEFATPEAATNAKYSYRNYRCDEEGLRSLRGDEDLYSEEKSLTAHGSGSPQIEYCRA